MMWIPGADHPITITPTGKRVTVTVDGLVVAATDDALTLQEASLPAVYYLPLDDVDKALLRRTEHSSYCPYKGDASYYSVVAPDRELTNVVWSYEEPYPAVAQIAGRVAFYQTKVDVKVG
jgi:uncharacterized protein (DUF427 family)